MSTIRQPEVQTTRSPHKYRNNENEDEDAVVDIWASNVSVCTSSSSEEEEERIDKCLRFSSDSVVVVDDDEEEEEDDDLESIDEDGVLVFSISFASSVTR